MDLVRHGLEVRCKDSTKSHPVVDMGKLSLRCPTHEYHSTGLIVRQVHLRTAKKRTYAIKS